EFFHIKAENSSVNIFKWFFLKSCYISFLVKIWYDQIKYHDFTKNHLNILTEEFSAMIWKNSRYMGVGIATSGNKVFVVMKFLPKGNGYHQFKSNVRNVIMNKAEK
uniref:SCP domain-containing protein n=1 Tax=Strongyloides stercoralis TaxID=6248 RepID=A0A0K0EK74_STRER